MNGKVKARFGGSFAVSVNLAELTPEFRPKVVAGLAALAARGLRFEPYFTLRSPLQQAALWRRSRPDAMTAQKVQELRASGCNYIADCLERVGPQEIGPRVTGALPGESWHQYGEAVDCFLENASDQPIWEDPAYKMFGTVGDSGGMWWGGHFSDDDHWQNSRAEPVERFGSLKGINDHLAQIWPAADGQMVSPAQAPALPITAVTSAFSLPLRVAAYSFRVDSTYQPAPENLPLLGGFAARIPSSNPNVQPFSPMPRFLGAVPTPAGSVLVIDSALELDTDGWVGDSGDPTWQSGTSLQYTERAGSLNANEVSYFVLPLPTVWPSKFGVQLGDYAAFLFRGRLTFGVFGDFGPHTKVGEGSLELLRRLGVERLRPDGKISNAGTEPGVLSIVFPGSGAASDRLNQISLVAAIDHQGADLFARVTS